MAILKDDTVTSEQGFTKTIDEAGLGMVMDNLQRFQYQYPIKSTVREIASNAVDSHKERDIAKSILLGESRIEDHYVVREGDLFEASKFNASYYDLNYLSDEQFVKLEYYEREDEERDLFRITDSGVGLGGNRLEGFFSLSYSTKRLNKSALGKFGIGAKAPLSTGVPSYRMISVYNGQKYQFDIFSRHIQSITDRWNEAGEDNILHTFANGYSFYSEATNEKNGVIIELEVKKHQRSSYKEAVQNQLLYFQNIKFNIYHGWKMDEEEHHSYSFVENVPVATSIVFQNDDFIISNNNLFTKPHLVLGAESAQVNYGLIDFKELELEPRTGNIGIKVDGSDIEITPSRESVVWSIQTRDVILAKFTKALEEASRIVGEQLKDEDILVWIDKNISLWSTSAGSNSVLRQLSGMINKADIVPVFSIDNSIRFAGPKKMLGIFGTYKSVNFENRFTNGNYKLRVNRTEENSWANISTHSPLFFSRKFAIPRKDSYIRSKYGLNHQFHMVSIPEMTDEVWDIVSNRVQDTIETQAAALDRANVNTKKDWLAEFKSQLKEKQKEYEKVLLFLQYASQSSLYVDYDSLVVPDDWVDNIASESETTEKGEVVVKKTREYVNHAARRKEEGKVFFKYASVVTPSGFQVDSKTSRRQLMAEHSWNQKEEYTDVLNDFDGTLVYGMQTANNKELSTQEEIENSDENKLKMLAGMLLGETGVGPIPRQFDIDNGEKHTFVGSSFYEMYPNDATNNRLLRGTKDLMLLKVSKQLAKSLTNFIPVSRFLLDRDESKIFVHMKIANWFTAKQLYQITQQLQFLANFSEISSFHAKEWKDLYEHTREHYFDGYDRIYQYPHEMRKSYVETLDTLYTFQRWLAEDKPPVEEIGEKSIELFGQPTNEVFVVDLDLIKRAEALKEWAEPVIDFLNNIPYFTKEAYINETTDKERFLESIRYYLRNKSVPMIDAQVVETEIVDEDEDED